MKHNNELYKHIEKITDSIIKSTALQTSSKNEQQQTYTRIFKYITKLKICNTWIIET